MRFIRTIRRLQDAWHLRRQRRQVRASETFEQAVTECLVDHTLQDMCSNGLTAASMRRIVSYHLGQLEVSHLTNVEGGFAMSKLGELAAVKGLAMEGWFDLPMLTKYASTGYQQLTRGVDPLFGNVKQTYRGGPIEADQIDLPSLEIQLRDSDATLLRRVLPDVWRYADPNSEFAKVHPGAHKVWREVVNERVTPSILKILMDTDPRNRLVATAERREAIAAIFDRS